MRIMYNIVVSHDVFGRRIRRALNSVYCARFNGREIYILGKRRRVRINYATTKTGDFHADRKYIILSASAAVVRFVPAVRFDTACVLYTRERYVYKRISVPTTMCSPPSPIRINLSRRRRTVSGMAQALGSRPDTCNADNV